MSQYAPKNGAMMFEVATPAGRSVHAGILDFSAAPGTVALPEHLIRNLWGLTTGDGQCQSNVTVTYRRLPKGEAVRIYTSTIVLYYQTVLLHCTILHCSSGTCAIYDRAYSSFNGPYNSK